MDSHDHSEQGSEKPEEPGEGQTGAGRRSRISGPEQKTLDRALAHRLERLGIDPWVRQGTRLVDLETGEAFDILPLKENWLFAQMAKGRAARFVAEFSAFAAEHGTDNLRAFVLRPEFRKAGPGELADTLAKLTKSYGRVMSNAAKDGIAEPVATFVHIRWDSQLSVWDVHLHVVVEVIPEMHDRLHLRLCRHFSTPRSIGPIRSVEAWVNYSSGWVIDHRELQRWPDQAEEEAWRLRSPQLIRKAGAFAKFARTLKDKTLRWEHNRLVIEQKPRRQKRNGAVRARDDSVAVVTVRIGNRRRRCAIYRWDRPIEDNAKQNAPPATIKFVVSSTAMESTTGTGSISSGPIRACFGRREVRRIRRCISTWEAIWGWGTPERLPRPIRRRFTRSGYIGPVRTTHRGSRSRQTI